jgi:hypothetical protein
MKDDRDLINTSTRTYEYTMKIRVRDWPRCATTTCDQNCCFECCFDACCQSDRVVSAVSNSHKTMNMDPRTVNRATARNTAVVSRPGDPSCQDTMLVVMIAALCCLFTGSSRVFLARADEAGQPDCTLCKDGSSPSFPDQDLTPVIEAQGYADLLAAVGITQVSCGMVPALLPLIPGGLNNTQCDSLQELAGPLCGCPSDGTPSPSPPPHQVLTPASPADTVDCAFCDPAANLSLVTVDVLNYTILESFANATCDELTTMSVALLVDHCPTMQKFVAEQCGCGPEPAEPTQPQASSQPPALAPADSNSAQQQQPGSAMSNGTCSLCWNGLVPSLIDKDISKLLIGNPQSREVMKNLNLNNVTCGQVHTLLPFVADKIDDASCWFIQTGIGGVCGCPPVVDNCVFCPGEPALSEPDKPFPYSRYYIETVLTCEETANVATQFRSDDETCFRAHITNFVCGCNDGQRSYFGTESTGQRAALAWIPRITGSLSLLGSIYIVQDVLHRQVCNRGAPVLTRGAANQPRPVYDSLMGAMAGFDIIYSICWILSSAPIWKYDQYGGPLGVYGAIGNYATCKAQGFFFQLGAGASLFYNVTLSVYYLLVIVYGMRETQVKKYRLYLTVAPVLAALVMAFKGLPYYTNILLMCSVAPPPEQETWGPIIGFVLFPVGFCLLVATCIMIVIFVSVRKKINATRKYGFLVSLRRSVQSFSGSSILGGNWTLSAVNDLPEDSARTTLADSSFFGRNGSALTRLSLRQRSVAARRNKDNVLRTVFWQSFFYLVAFLVSYPVWFIAIILSDSSSYRLWIVAVTLTPLQGFLNFLVYVRPRWIQYRLDRQKAQSSEDRSAVPRNRQAVAVGAKPTTVSESPGALRLHSQDGCDEAKCVSRELAPGNDASWAKQDDTSFSVDTSEKGGTVQMARRYSRVNFSGDPSFSSDQGEK